MDATTTCTLTLENEGLARYEDDDYFSGTRAVGGKILGRGMARRVVDMLHRMVDSYPGLRHEELTLLGTALYEIAFSKVPLDREESVDSAFRETLDRCRAQGRKVRLRIVLSQDTTDLATYPWEFLFLERDNNQGFFLAGQDPSLSLTRYVPNSERWSDMPPDATGRLKILVVLSTPDDPAPLAGLNIPKITKFASHLAELDPTRFEVTTVECPSATQLSQAIERARPHIIHFIGHGEDGKLALSRGEDVIAEETEAREAAIRVGDVDPGPVQEAAWINANTATGIFKAGLESQLAPNRLIFLHSCESAASPRTRSIISTFNDVARSVAGGDRITGVIAMQYTIGVDDAELFARAFYEAIVRGNEVAEAVKLARKKFAESPLRGQQQWWDSPGFGTPVSYLRGDAALMSRKRDDEEADAALGAALQTTPSTTFSPGMPLTPPVPDRQPANAAEPRPSAYGQEGPSAAAASRQTPGHGAGAVAASGDLSGFQQTPRQPQPRG